MFVNVGSSTHKVYNTYFCLFYMETNVKGAACRLQKYEHHKRDAEYYIHPEGCNFKNKRLSQD